MAMLRSYLPLLALVALWFLLANTVGAAPATTRIP